MQANVFVQIAGIAEWPEAVFALERLESGVRANVNFQSVLPRIQFPAVDANVTLFRCAHIADDRFQLGCRGGHNFVTVRRYTGRRGYGRLMRRWQLIRRWRQ